jgi:glutathione peroxidase-family protein
LEKLYEQRKDGAFTILGVSVDENADAVAPFVRSAGITYPVMEKPSLDGWYVPGLPIAYLVSRDGKIVRHYDSRMDIADVRGDIKAALAR